MDLSRPVALNRPDIIDMDGESDGMKRRRQGLAHMTVSDKVCHPLLIHHIYHKLHAPLSRINVEPPPPAFADSLHRGLHRLILYQMASDRGSEAAILPYEHAPVLPRYDAIGTYDGNKRERKVPPVKLIGYSEQLLHSPSSFPYGRNDTMFRINKEALALFLT